MPFQTPGEVIVSSFSLSCASSLCPVSATVKWHALFLFVVLEMIPTPWLWLAASSSVLRCVLSTSFVFVCFLFRLALGAPLQAVCKYHLLAGLRRWAARMCGTKHTGTGRTMTKGYYDISLDYRNVCSVLVLSMRAENYSHRSRIC